MLPVPPRSEQDAIVEHIHQSITKIQSLKSKTEESIDRLREMRSTLITAAVTGQIDVATWSKGGETDRRLDQIEEELTQKEATA